jgi:hypothetical protein
VENSRGKAENQQGSDWNLKRGNEVRGVVKLGMGGSVSNSRQGLDVGNDDECSRRSQTNPSRAIGPRKGFMIGRDEEWTDLVERGEGGQGSGSGARREEPDEARPLALHIATARKTNSSKSGAASKLALSSFKHSTVTKFTCFEDDSSILQANLIGVESLSSDIMINFVILIRRKPRPS